MILRLSSGPDDSGGVFPTLAEGVAVQVPRHFVAQPGQRRALVHDLPSICQHLLQNAAFQVLDDLGVLGGSDLSLPPADFVDLAVVRPDEEQGHDYSRAEREPPRPDARPTVQGRVHFAREGNLFFFLETLLFFLIVHDTSSGREWEKRGADFTVGPALFSGGRLSGHGA